MGGYTNSRFSAVDYKAGRLGAKTVYIYVNPELGVERRVVKRVWTGKAVGDISTIEDEASIEEVKETVSRMKILRG